MSHQLSKKNDMNITYIPKTTKYQFFSSVNANYKLNILPCNYFCTLVVSLGHDFIIYRQKISVWNFSDPIVEVMHSEIQIVTVC